MSNRVRNITREVAKDPAAFHLACIQRDFAACCAALDALTAAVTNLADHNAQVTNAIQARSAAAVALSAAMTTAAAAAGQLQPAVHAAALNVALTAAAAAATQMSAAIEVEAAAVTVQTADFQAAKVAVDAFRAASYETQSHFGLVSQAIAEKGAK